MKDLCLNLEFRGQSPICNSVPLFSAIAAALLVLTGSAQAACDDTLLCTKFGTSALSNNNGAANSAVGYGALFSNTSGQGNTAVGAVSLLSNSTGSSNTGLGTGTLENNTTGSNNTAVGTTSLFSNITGGSNTAVGDSVLYSNTSGQNNTAVGLNALTNNTIASDNTAVGASALARSTTGDLNTAVGSISLANNTTGTDNTAVGYSSLTSNISGTQNTANGFGALAANTIGNSNTATGAGALTDNKKGQSNTAHGAYSLASNLGNFNTAVGQSALVGNTTGARNIALGSEAGKNLTTGSDNIIIGNVGIAAESKTIRIGTTGTQTKTFIAGIKGVTVSGGAAVLVNANGQLGVASSSREVKEDIHPMGDASARLMALRPVQFRYKEPDDEGQKPVQFGLVAEEVAEVMPELTVRNAEGKPETVAYHVLPSLLLNEFQKQQKELEAVRSELAGRDKEIADLQSQMKALRKVTEELVAASMSKDSVGMR